MGLLYDLILSVFILTAIAAAFGNYLDNKFHTTPFLSITLGILAIIIGLTRLVIKSKELYKNQDNEKKE